MPLKDARVYVVDDDADAREAVTVLVRTLGLAVHEFESGEAFLERYRGHRPACIVADLRMLGMSGLEMLVELRRRGLTIPVIILTAHADTPTTVQAMKIGAFTTLDKPCRDSELWDTIRAALQEDIKRMEEDKRRQEARDRVASLSPALRDVAQLMVLGDANKVIALKLSVGMRTVEARKQAVFRTLQVESIAELVQLILMVEPDWLPPQPGDPPRA